MGLFSLVVYGVGDMVGAGIYGTVGDAAVQMGNAVWLSFVFSMVAAVLMVLERRPGEPAGGFEVPIVVPALGVLVNAGAIVGGIVILHCIGRARSVTETSLAAAEVVEDEAA